MNNNGHHTSWIGVDFDQCLVTYDHWRGPGHHGEAIEPMCDRVRAWLSQGIKVKIFTARVSQAFPEQIDESRACVERFCLKEFGEILEVTNEKDQFCIQIWDDIAVGVVPNRGHVAAFSPKDFINRVIHEPAASNPERLVTAFRK